MVTSGTYDKKHIFMDEERLAALNGGLLKYARKYRWNLEAWAVFPNHYHFVAHSPSDGDDGAHSLLQFLADFHQHSASWVNQLDHAIGRKVWHSFWETLLTYERSYLARLNYVHQNAVHHGIVTEASGYDWCSAAWFEKYATTAQIKTIYSFKCDRLNVLDDF